jgi:hypothetical protein
MIFSIWLRVSPDDAIANRYDWAKVLNDALIETVDSSSIADQR